MNHFDPFKIETTLYGCASYEESWKPGIDGWGSTDEDSYLCSFVSTIDYEILLAMYCEAKGISLPERPIAPGVALARWEKYEANFQKWKMERTK